MISIGAPRIAMTEYVASDDVLPRLADVGYPADRAVAALARLSASLQRQFSFESSESPIVIEGGRVKIMNLSGVLSLAPGVEIDLAPKFLGHLYDGWREDWLAIANLTGHGRILAPHLVIGSYGRSSDLASLIGRTFIAEFRSNQRRPLRVYRRRKWSSWVLEGEIDPDSISDPGTEGYAQTATVLDAANPYTALIRAAAAALLREVRDPEVRAEVAEIRDQLPDSKAPTTHLPPVPSRHRRWAPLVELAQQILETFDVTLRRRDPMGDLRAPGLLVRTWQAWERLIFVAIRSRWGDERVHAQEELPWARRQGGVIAVKPDTTIHRDEGVVPLDAKYKTRLDRGRTRIAQTDLMEASAFIDACDGRSIVLLYPRLAEPDTAPEDCGSCSEFDRVEIGDKSVIGAEVEVRGIGLPGGYARFSDNLTTGLLTIHPDLRSTPELSTLLS